MTEVKRGVLKFYHRGLLHKKWREYKFILYDSSLLTWYADLKHKKPDGMVLLKDVERFICVGPYTRFLPDFPQLEHEYDQVALIAFPMSVKDRDKDIVWLLCDDVEDLNLWMKAIVETLPSHTFQMCTLAPMPPLSSTDENTQTETELNSTEAINSAPLFKADTIGIPLAAGLIGNCLQAHTMKTKENPLHRAGYDYGDTLWGTGEGWGHFAPLEIPGYAGIGGSGCYSNHIDLLRNEDDEQRLKNIEDRMGTMVNHEQAVDQAVYQLSKNRIGDNGRADVVVNYDEDNIYAKDDEFNEEVNESEDEFNEEANEIENELNEEANEIENEYNVEDNEDKDDEDIDVDQEGLAFIRITEALKMIDGDL